MRPLGALRRTFRSLGTRNYRLFFVGQTVSATGTWMQRVAQDWLILELGGGAVGLSIGIGLQAAPSWLLGMAGGVIADRFNIRRVMLWTQSFFALLSVALGWMALTGTATIWMVYIFSFLLGCANVIDKPARQTFVMEMVGAEGATNAISLNSSINNAARLVGPAIAGVLIGATNTGVAFLVNALTFVAILIALILIDPKSLDSTTRIPPGKGQIVEGLRYSLRDPELRPLLISTLVVSTLAQNFRVILPLFAAFVFAGGASKYGVLMSGLGVGALIAALFCANIIDIGRRHVAWFCLGFGIALLLAATVSSYWVLVILMVTVGFGNTGFNTTSQTLVLLKSNSEMRGRTLALRQLFSNGLTPVGSVAIGWIAATTSPRVAMGVGGIAALLAALLHIRPSSIFPRLGKAANTQGPAEGLETY